MSDNKQENEDRRDDDSIRRDEDIRRQLDEPIPAGTDKRLEEESRRSDFERRHQYEE